MKYKLFTLLITIVASVVTLNAEIYSGECGENLSWELNTSDSTLTISGSGDMYDSFYGSFWYSYRSYIKYVVIENGVTSIGNYAFSNCQNLVSMPIPNSITRIGRDAFDGCISLESIVIPNSVTKLDEYAFYGCSGLTSVTIGTGVRSLQGTFSNCTGLSSITIPSNVDTISGAFWGCNDLTAIHITDIAKWCNIDFTYYGYAIGPLEIAHHLYLNGEEVTSLVIPNGVTYISDGAFRGCYSLTSVSIPNGLSAIGYEAFAECQNLSSVTFGEDVNSIGRYAFYGCNSSLSLTVPDNVSSIGEYAFGNIYHVVYHGAAEGSPWGARCVNGFVDGWLYYKDASKTELLACHPDATGSIVIPNSVTSIGWSAFDNCSGITSITIPESVNEVAENAFLGCTGLPVIDNIRYADTYLVEVVDKTLSSYTIQAGTKWIGTNAFRDCSALTSITLPESVKAIGSYSFSGCSNLQSIIIPEGVQNIPIGTFNYCSSLASATLPESTAYISYYAFGECSSLTSIVIPASVDSMEDHVFERCNNLTSVTINSNAVVGEDFTSEYIPDLSYIFGNQVQEYIIGEGVTRIGYHAFNHFSQKISQAISHLTAITLPSTLTDIASEAFYNCVKLTSLTIPDGVITIGEDAFLNVKSVFYNGNATGAPWGALCLNGECETDPEPEPIEPAVISVTDNSLDDWNDLPTAYVAEAVCPIDAEYRGLKNVKVYATKSYINILVEPDMDDVTDLEWVPFHIFIDTDNSDLTGGYGDLFADANTDIMIEGALFAYDELVSYAPGVFEWWGEIGGEGWEWTDPNVEHSADDCWGAIVCEGALDGCSSQYVDGKFEIQILRNNIPATWNDSVFGIGFEIEQEWSSVGILPLTSPTDENPMGKTNKLKVRFHKANDPTEVEPIGVSTQEKVSKFFHNGQILIRRGDKTYLLTGQEVQ